MASAKELRDRIKAVQETKKITGAMHLISSTKLRRAKVDLAQFREMEAFTQFSSDLDETTKKQLAYGQSLMRLLRQAQYQPYSQHRMVILLVAALNHTMEDVPLSELLAYRDQMLAAVEHQCDDVCRHIDRNGKLTERDRKLLLSAVKDFARQWNAGGEAGEETDDGER